MLLNLTLPPINPYMSVGLINAIHASEGQALALGAKLMDVTIDLSAAAAHDCPPISHYRLVVRDRVWLRRLDVTMGDSPAVGDSLALFSTEADEPLDATPARQVRLTIAGVIAQPAWGDFH